MNYRKFGNTDLVVSEICYGPMRFAAKEPGADDQSRAGQRALEHAMGFFCIRPFLAGLLTDRRADRSQLPAGDRFHDPRWAAAYERLALINDALGDQIGSWTDFAIKFSLCHPLVTSLIVGLNSEAQVDGVLAAADGNYPDRSVFDQVWQIYQQHGLVTT